VCFGAVDGGVTWISGTDGSTYHQAKHRAHGRSYASTDKTTMKTCGSYAGACASAHRSPNERIASTILGFHEFHAENLLPLDRLLARFLLQRDRAIGNAQKRSRDSF
jgi:hypothetical protein